MTFTFNTTIPAAQNNPSNDQPIMLSNNVATNGILNVDHITFNEANGGQHKQVTFNNKNVPGSQTDPQSVLYTNSGTASTISQLFFKNQNAILPVSLIAAYAQCSGSSVNGAIVPNNQFNISSVSRTAAGQYQVTLLANVTTGTNYGIIVTSNNVSLTSLTNIIANYTISSATVFNLIFNSKGVAVTDPTNFTFIVLQI